MSNAPTRLNGYAVAKSFEHSNGYVTAMVYMPDNRATPYCVATWTPVCGKAWVWGHYEQDEGKALATFETVKKRNNARGAA